MSRPLLAAPVSGSSAWIIYQVLHEPLQQRIRQLECDPRVHGDLVRDLRGTAAAIQEAARQYRELMNRSRPEVADSVEVPGGDVPAGLGGPPRWVDARSVAASLGCTVRWVTQLCLAGRLAAVKVGRVWSIDPDSVQDFKQRGANAA